MLARVRIIFTSLPFCCLAAHATITTSVVVVVLSMMYVYIACSECIIARCVVVVAAVVSVCYRHTRVRGRLNTHTRSVWHADKRT